MAGKPVNITIGATVASSLGAAVRDAKNQLGTLGAKISSLNDKKVKVDQLVAMKAQTNDLGRAYGQARKRADELSAAYAAMGPPTAAQTREMRAAEQAAEKAGAALTKQREALRELRASLHSAGVDTRNLGTESVRLGSQLDTLKRRTEALSRARQADKDNRDKRGQHLGNVMSTAAVGMTLAAPLKTAMDFEAQMSRVGAVSNSTKEQQVQLTAKAREMGRDTKFSALEAGQGMEYLAMAGFNANQQMAAIGGVLDVAAAAGTELGRTSDIVSNALTGFGLQADQAGRVGDVLTKTFTGSNTTLESLGETLKYVAPVASSAGASIELVAAMTGVLGDAGIQGSMAGTTLRNTFLRLIAPAKDAQKHMKQLGISAEQMREIMADPEGQQAAHYIKKMGIDVADENGNLRDWMDILTELSVKMGNLSQADRLEAASSIFGKYAVSGGHCLIRSVMMKSISKNKSRICVNRALLRRRFKSTALRHVINSRIGIIKICLPASRASPNRSQLACWTIRRVNSLSLEVPSPIWQSKSEMFWLRLHGTPQKTLPHWRIRPVRLFMRFPFFPVPFCLGWVPFCFSAFLPTHSVSLGQF